MIESKVELLLLKMSKMEEGAIGMEFTLEIAATQVEANHVA